MLEEQNVDRRANREADIVAEDAGDRMLRLEDVTRALDEHQAVEIFVLW